MSDHSDGCEILNTEPSAISFSNRLQGNRSTYYIPMLFSFYVQFQTPCVIWGLFFIIFFDFSDFSI